MRSTKQLLGLVLIILIAVDFAVCQQTSNESIIKKKLNKIDQISDSKINTTSRAKNGLIADLHSNWVDKFKNFITREIQKIVKILGNPTNLPSTYSIISDNSQSGSTLKLASSPIVETVPTLWGSSTMHKELGELSTLNGIWNTPYSGEQTLTHEIREVMAQSAQTIRSIERHEQS